MQELMRPYAELSGIHVLEKTFRKKPAYPEESGILPDKKMVFNSYAAIPP